ncbi:beta-carotene hydroxylase 2, chloroplastic isoform X2 [Coffea arabica]|uniref:beta-carotene 3-hydroxylase n=1 Tax=Coffea arabica TaxID=13443 RepID=A0ABM4WQU2_COFAR
MAAGIAVAAGAQTVCFRVNSFLTRKPTYLVADSLTFSPLAQQFSTTRRKPRLTVCFVLEDEELKAQLVTSEEEAREREKAMAKRISDARTAEKLARKRSERFTYLVAAVMSSFGITSMAVLAVYYRFVWQMEGGEVPYSEMFGTFALSVGAAVGMEFWARWAHKALWHASLWHMHESHHKPREGPFELNDVFAIINAVPAIALLSYGFFHKGLIPGLCFGAKVMILTCRALGLQCLAWLTCSSTMVWCTRDFRLVPLQMFLTSEELQLHISCIIRTSSAASHMGCS